MNQSSATGESGKSKVDIFSGEHTSTLIVAVLFIIVFIGLGVYLLTGKPYSELVLNGLFSLLSLFGGFFIGTFRK